MKKMSTLCLSAVACTSLAFAAQAEEHFWGVKNASERFALDVVLTSTNASGEIVIDRRYFLGTVGNDLVEGRIITDEEIYISYIGVYPADAEPGQTDKLLWEIKLPRIPASECGFHSEYYEKVQGGHPLISIYAEELHLDPKPYWGEISC